MAGTRQSSSLTSALAAAAVIAVAVAAALFVLSRLLGDDASSVDVVQSEAGAASEPPAADTSTDGPAPEPESADAAAPQTAVRYVAAAASGRGDGSAQGQAAPLSSLDQLIAEADGPLDVRVVADSGTIPVTDSVTLTSGGTSQAPVTIRSWPPSGRRVVLTGTRTAPYDVAGDPGDAVFRLGSGADHLRFVDLAFENVGVAFRVAADIRDLDVRQVSATNVRRFLDTTAADGVATASITGLRVSDVSVRGFSKSAFRLRYGTRDVLLQDVVGDSEQQDGDNFAVGVSLSGQVSDVVLRRVQMTGTLDTTGEYWNGDGFSVERGVTRVQFIDTLAAGHSEGGYDIKGTEITMRSVRAVDNKRNYRFWGLIDVQDCEGLDPNKRGGTGTQAQVQVAEGAVVVMSGCRFVDADPETIVFDVDGPAATLQVIDSDVRRAAESQLSTVEPGNALETDDLGDQLAS